MNKKNKSFMLLEPGKLYRIKKGNRMGFYLQEQIEKYEYGNVMEHEDGIVIDKHDWEGELFMFVKTIAIQNTDRNWEVDEDAKKCLSSMPIFLSKNGARLIPMTIYWANYIEKAT